MSVFPAPAGGPRVLDLGFARIPLDQGMAACWWRTFFPSLSLFLLTAAFIVTKTGRDALYFQQGGLLYLPKAYLGIAILSAPAATGTLGLMRMLGPRRARVASLLLMAALQALFFLSAEPGGGWMQTLVFVLIPLLYGVILSLAWLLGADLLDLAPRHVLARLYSTMGASSMLGGLAGAAVARSLAERIDPAAYFLIGGALLLAGAGVNVAAHRAFPVIRMRRASGMPMPSTPGGEIPPSAGLLTLLRHRYLLLLAAIGMVASIAGVLIEFQFYSGAATAGPAGREQTRVFADFYIWLNGAAVLLQVLAAPALQRRFGIYGSLFILPMAVAGAAALVVATASMAARTGLRVTEGGVKSSIHRSNWEQTYLPVERGQRAAAKLLVDGMAARAGEAAAAGLLLISDWEGALLGRVLLAASVAWLGLTALLHRDRRTGGLAEGDGHLRPDLPIPDG